MKLTVKQPALQKALRVVQKSISTKPQLPILSCIQIIAQKSLVTLAATDLYMGVTVEIPATIEEAGTFAVPGKYFAQMIATLTDPTINLETKDTSLILKTDGSTTKLVGMNADDFPDFPQFSEKTHEFSFDEFQEILQRIAFSSSSDQTRPILTGVLLSFEDTSTRVVATDGFRLAIQTTPINLGITETMILPAKSLLDVFKSAEEEKVKTIEFSISTELKQARFVVGPYTFFIRLLDGEYPPYQKIIPTHINTVVRCNRADLEEKLHQSLIFNQDNSFITQFIISGEGVELFASSPSAGENRSTLVGPDIKGEQVTIAFNTRYILDFLKVIPDEWITLEITESLRPARFLAPSLKDYQYVVMPFRVTS